MAEDNAMLPPAPPPRRQADEGDGKTLLSAREGLTLE